MEELKSLFGENSLNYEEFSKLLGDSKDIKLVNLKSGNYVDKAKYDKLVKSVNDSQAKYSDFEKNNKEYANLQKSYYTLKTDYETLLNKHNETEKMGLINSANVNPKFAKFVYSEVSSQVSDGKDFQSALTEYLNENKEFLNNVRSTYRDLEQGSLKPKNEHQIINDKIRGIKK